MFKPSLLSTEERTFDRTDTTDVPDVKSWESSCG